MSPEELLAAIDARWDVAALDCVRVTKWAETAGLVPDPGAVSWIAYASAGRVKGGGRWADDGRLYWHCWLKHGSTIVDPCAPYEFGSDAPRILPLGHEERWRYLLPDVLMAEARRNPRTYVPAMRQREAVTP